MNALEPCNNNDNDVDDNDKNFITYIEDTVKFRKCAPGLIFFKGPF